MTENESSPEQMEMVKESIKKIVEKLGAGELLSDENLKKTREQAVRLLRNLDPATQEIPPEIQQQIGQFWVAVESSPNKSSGMEIAALVLTAGTLYESGRTNDCIEELESALESAQYEDSDEVYRMIEALVSSLKPSTLP